MSIVDSVKKGYYFCEDKYYSVLDKINKYVPVYKVVDPIDKVFPSFILLIAAVACLIIFFIFFTMPAAAFTATIQVVNEAGDPIAGVSISLTMGEETITLSTLDPDGEAEVELAEQEADAEASFSKGGYDTLSRQLLLIAGETTTVTLRETVAQLQEPQERQIKVVDGSTSQLLRRNVILTFECRGGGSPPGSKQNSTGEFTVLQMPSCINLVATASATGYERQSKTINSPVTFITLNPLVEDTTGTINVTVKDAAGSAVPDAAVILTDETTHAPVDSGSTSQAGSISFTGVDPGTYTVSATATDDRSGQRTGIVVAAGETKNVQVTIPALPPEKMIFLQLVEQGTQNKVSGATVMIYRGLLSNNDLAPIASKTSDSEGKVKQLISDENYDYVAVITHQDYITKIEQNPPLLDADDSPTQVALTRATPENRARVVVVVEDEEGAPIGNASVWLYKDSLPSVPLNHPEKKTNADGNTLFNNLSAGTYFAIARDPATGAQNENPQNTTVTVAAGGEEVLFLMLVIGEDSVEATVYDADSASEDKIEGAYVEFINVLDGNVLSACLTSLDGKCESEPIKADKTIYVKASKEGFLSAVADRAVPIVRNGNARVEIGLRHLPIGDAPAIDTRFIGFCEDRDCDRGTGRITSDETGATTYYGRFELTLLSGLSFQGIAQHIRVGLDSQLQLPADYGIKIDAVYAPASTSALLFSCWNNDADDPFTAPSECPNSVERDAKQASVSYPSFNETIILPITVKFTIQPGLPDGTELRIPYRAKADVDGALQKTPEKVHIFRVNEALCEEGSGFAWQVELQNPDGSTTTIPLDPDAEAPGIAVNTEYGLSYWLYNCSGRDFTSVSLEAVNQNPESISFNPFTEPIPNFALADALPAGTTSFPNDTAIENTFSIYPRMETGSSATEIAFTLGIGQSLASLPGGTTATAFLKVLAGREMLVKDLPATLPDVGTPPLSGRAVDAENQQQGIADAYVVAEIEGHGVLEADNGGRTNAQGRFSFANLPNLHGVVEMKVRISKAGYRTKVVSIPVGRSPITPHPSYDCISFDLEEAGVERSNATTADFWVLMNDCMEGAEIRLETELVLLDEAGSYLNETQDAQFALGSDGSKKLRVKAQPNALSDPRLGIGEYYINLLAKFESDEVGFRPVETMRVFVEDDTSCFTISKTSYDISLGRDYGTVVTKPECFEFIEDLLLPEIRKAHVHADEKFVSFDVNIPQLSPGLSRLGREAPIDQNGPVVLPITKGGGFVKLDWVDVHMTDEKHSGLAKHNVFAHYYRTEQDWASITAEVPYTAADDLNIIGPVVDNEGWVDTETYHPLDATYLNEVTPDPIWQAQHNVCNRNLPNADAELLPCSVNDYFGGLSLVPYRYGSMADQIRIEKEGPGTRISLVRWQYTSTDKDHQGLIDFTVVNNGLAGETYALIEVEDSVKGSGPVQEEIPFDYVFTELGVNETSAEHNILTPEDSQEIAPGQMLGVSLSTASPSFKVYSSSNDATLAQLLSEMGGVTLNTNHIWIDMKTKSGESNEAEILLLKYYANGAWAQSGPYDLILEEGVSDIDIDLPGTYPVEALALVNLATESTDINTIVVDTIRVTEQQTETTGPETTEGSSAIPAGETRMTFQPPKTLKPADFDRVEYTIASPTAGISIGFDDTGGSATTNPNAGVLVLSSLPEIIRETETEYFHIRLQGAESAECKGGGGLEGKTGYIAKPNILLNWQWDSIGVNACDADNEEYVYCDPAQFTVEAVKKLQRIKELAAEDLNANQGAINDLRWFDAYLIADTYSLDFRNDFVQHYTALEIGSPLTSMTGSYWDRYLTGQGSSEKLRFKLVEEDGSETEPASLEAGLYEVFINLDFEPGRQYGFFYDYTDQQGNTVVELTAAIEVLFRKLQEPAVDSPFYHLPFNGSLGLEGEEWHRDSYGLGFSGEPILLTEEGTVFTDSTTGASVLSTEVVSDLATINLSQSARGMVLEVGRTSDGSINSLKFSPSYATPVLMAVLPQDGKAKAFYYLTESPSGFTMPSPNGSFMNFWTGSGSTMGERPFNCVDYAGSPLTLWQDSKAETASCSAEAESYGYSFPIAEQGNQLYYETIFYIPSWRGTGDSPLNVHLNKACSDSSNFYSPTENTSAGSLVSLTTEEVKKGISSVQDVLDLVDESYVCVTTPQEQGDSIRFWWNPQEILSELDSVKQGINPDWGNALACTPA